MNWKSGSDSWAARKVNLFIFIERDNALKLFTHRNDLIFMEQWNLVIGFERG
ncbi:hypothetical protein [Marinithermofilum abyssi]|uniref:hypothetical protein n=1 Tax=Marinithermofilum abyssi TaxID=1571185 RepID=UPI00166A291D|nr:hypothetical protein [Marinithermofilum abyssi]